MPHEPEVGLEVDAARLQRVPAAPERVLADRVEEDVVRLAAREVLLGVVDNVVGAERPDGSTFCVLQTAVTWAPSASRAGSRTCRAPTRRRRPRCPAERAAHPQSRQRGQRPTQSVAASSKRRPWARGHVAGLADGDIVGARARGAPKTWSPAGNPETSAPMSATFPRSRRPGCALRPVRPVKTRGRRTTGAADGGLRPGDRRRVDADQHLVLRGRRRRASGNRRPRAGRSARHDRGPLIARPPAATVSTTLPVFWRDST